MPTFHKQSTKKKDKFGSQVINTACKNPSCDGCCPGLRCSSLSAIRLVAASPAATWNTQRVSILDQWLRFAVLHRRVLPSLSSCFIPPPCMQALSHCFTLGAEKLILILILDMKKERERRSEVYASFLSTSALTQQGIHRFKEPLCHATSHLHFSGIIWAPK